MLSEYHETKSSLRTDLTLPQGARSPRARSPLRAISPTPRGSGPREKRATDRSPHELLSSKKDQTTTNWRGLFCHATLPLPNPKPVVEPIRVLTTRLRRLLVSTPEVRTPCPTYTVPPHDSSAKRLHMTHPNTLGSHNPLPME